LASFLYAIAMPITPTAFDLKKTPNSGAQRHLKTLKRDLEKQYAPN
jgi:hypothetical protein